MVQDYLKAIVDVFKQAEDLELIRDLHALNSCMNTIRQFPVAHMVATSTDPSLSNAQ